MRSSRCARSILNSMGSRFIGRGWPSLHNGASLNLASCILHETEPVELAAQPWFLNCAAKLDTEKMPRQLIAGILGIEQGMGRQRRQKNGPRIIDIDILLFGTSIIDIPSLTVPHPKLHERRF